jgi:hypothetical protein
MLVQQVVPHDYTQKVRSFFQLFFTYAGARLPTRAL